METTRIQTEAGPMMVPALKHKHSKHLCVTMHSFGQFEITHIASGHKVCGSYERAGNAMADMLALSIALISIGVSDDATYEDLKQAIAESDIVIDELGMTISQYITLNRLVNEFPWETYEESPFKLVDDRCLKLERLYKEGVGA